MADLNGIINFSGTESVIDFNTIADEELITNQFTASMCVTFSGAIYGMTNSGDVGSFPNSGGVIASNWLYNGGGLQGLCAPLDTEQTASSLTHGAGNSATGIDWRDPNASVVFGTFTSARYPSGPGAQPAMPPRYHIERLSQPTQEQASGASPFFRITALGMGPAPARVTVLLQADFELITGPPPSQDPDTATAATSPQLRQLSFRQLPGPALTSDE